MSTSSIPESLPPPVLSDSKILPLAVPAASASDTWNATYPYRAGDGCRYSQKQYTARVANTGHTPGQNSYWRLESTNGSDSETPQQQQPTILSWDPFWHYQANDRVRNNNFIWTAAVENVTNRPTDPENANIWVQQQQPATTPVLAEN